MLDVYSIATKFGWIIQFLNGGLSCRWQNRASTSITGALLVRGERCVVCVARNVTIKSFSTASPEQVLWQQRMKKTSVEAYMWSPDDIETVKQVLR